MARNISLPILASGAIPLKDVREWDFQVAVGKYAESRGWLVDYTGQTGYMGKNGKWRALATKGRPDMWMVRSGRLVVAELKSDKRPERATPEQQQWLDALAAVPGVEAYLWRPRDAATALERLK